MSSNEENTSKLNEVKLEDNVTSSASATVVEDIVNPWNVTSATNSGVDYDKLIGT